MSLFKVRRIESRRQTYELNARKAAELLGVELADGDQTEFHFVPGFAATGAYGIDAIDLLVIRKAVESEVEIAVKRPCGCPCNAIGKPRRHRNGELCLVKDAANCSDRKYDGPNRDDDGHRDR